jgi:uncharacterized membrane protein
MGRDVETARVEVLLGGLLRTGVVLAASVVLVGGILFLVQFGLTKPEYASFHGEPKQLRELGGIWSAATKGDSLGMIQLGLSILIATPIARVAFSGFAFAREREPKYVVFALIVLGLLFYGLMGSRA